MTEAAKDFENTIKELAQKHLPAAIGDELMGLIEQGKSDARALASTKDQLEERTKELRALETLYNDSRKKLDAHKAIDDREKAVQEREDKLTISDAETRAKNAEEKLALVLQLTNTVFKEPNKVLEINRSISTPVKDQYGNIQSMHGNEFETYRKRED